MTLDKFLMQSTIAVVGVLIAATAYAQDSTISSDQGSEESPTNTPQEQEGFFKEEIVDVELFDGEQISGRLCLPTAEAAKIPTLVIFVHGTGPATYLTKRKIGNKTFNFFDFYANKFCEQGDAFYTYNKRGCINDDKPPLFDEVDRDKFRKVVPRVEAQDLANVIDTLKENERLVNARVVLFGHSEGTVVAALVAEKYPELSLIHISEPTRPY